MHILSSKNYSEFLATPSLVRFDYCDNKPILLIKASSLVLKYLVRGVKIQLIFTPAKDNQLIYALKVFDDSKKPALLWSVLGSEEELSAIKELEKYKKCPIYLFNEVNVNVAWLEFNVDVPLDLNEMIKNTEINNNSKFIQTNKVSEELNNIHLKKKSDESLCIIDIDNNAEWNEVRSIYIKNNSSSSPISIFSENEGFQQEELAIWLTDAINPKGAMHSPQILNGKINKELTDLVLSSEHGAILFESKALSILCGDDLPDMEKLKNKISKCIKKAESQLTGAIKKLRNNVEVRNKDGELLEINREGLMHAIILIPDFDLLYDVGNLGKELLRSFLIKNQSFLHILDIAELLRVVQVAKTISSMNNKVSPIAAFDFYLMKRFDKAYEVDKICCELIARVE